MMGPFSESELQELDALNLPIDVYHRIHDSVYVGDPRKLMELLPRDCSARKTMKTLLFTWLYGGERASIIPDGSSHEFPAWIQASVDELINNDCTVTGRTKSQPELQNITPKWVDLNEE